MSLCISTESIPETNEKPLLFDETPSYISTQVARPPGALSINVEDPDQDDMKIIIKWKNHLDQWITLCIYDDMPDGTYSFAPPSTNDWIWGNTTYSWSVNVTDGTAWTNQTFIYRTGGSRYDVSNNGVVNFQDAGLCWVNRDSVVDYDGLFDVNQNGVVNFQDAGLTWVNRD